MAQQAEQFPEQAAPGASSSVLADVAPGGADTRAMLLAKEQEVSALREHALKGLERQLQELKAANMRLQSQLSDLTSDFTYNLGLLAERDAELERYDTSLVEMSSRLTLQVASISSLQGALAEAQAELVAERGRSSEAEAAFRRERAAAAGTLQQLQADHAADLLHQKEGYEAQKRELQRALAAAHEAAEVQASQAAAAAALAQQRAEASHRAALAEATQAAELAAATAARREEAAAAAAVREAAALAASEAARAQVAELEGRLATQRSQLEAALAAQEAAADASARQAAAAQAAADSAQQGHEKALAALQQQLREAQEASVTQLEAQAARLKEEQQQQLSGIKGMLTAMEARFTAEQAAACAAQQQLEGACEALEQQLDAATGVVQQLQAELAAANAAAAQVDPLQQQVAGLQQALEETQATLAAREELLGRYQAQLVHTGELQQQLHHSLSQLSAQLLGPDGLPLPHPVIDSTLQPAAAAAVAPPSSPMFTVQQQRSVNDRGFTPHTHTTPAGTSDGAGGWLWQVVGQRDAAAAALAEAQQQLVAQAAHIAELHRQLAASQAAGSAGHATSVTQPQVMPATASEGQVSGAAGAPPLDLPGGPSGLSVLGDLPPSPGSGASFWLGPGLAALGREGTTTSVAAAAAGPAGAPAVEPQPTGRASPMVAAAAAAAGVAGGVAGPAGGLEDLLAKYGAQLVRSSSPDLGSPHSRAASPSGGRYPGGAGVRRGSPAPEVLREVVVLRGALLAADATNERLSATLATLRAEMEGLIAAGPPGATEQEQGGGEPCAAGPASPTRQVTLLRAELAAADEELAAAQQHVAVLQQQLAASTSGPAHHPSAGEQQQAPGVSAETLFLRQRAAALLADNRRYRRMALQLQLVGPGPEPLQPMSTDTLGPLPQVAVVPGPPHKLLPDTTAAALDTPAGQQPAPSVPALASAAESSTPAGPPAASSAPTPAAADGTTPAAQLVQLQQELGTARAQLAVLGEENEALLELSNSLRAALERQRGPPGAGLAWGAQAALLTPVAPPDQVLLLPPAVLSPGPAHSHGSPPVGWPWWSQQQQAAGGSPPMPFPGSIRPPDVTASLQPLEQQQQQSRETWPPSARSEPGTVPAQQQQPGPSSELQVLGVPARRGSRSRPSTAGGWGAGPSGSSAPTPLTAAATTGAAGAGPANRVPGSSSGAGGGSSQAAAAATAAASSSAGLKQPSSSSSSVPPAVAAGAAPGSEQPRQVAPSRQGMAQQQQQHQHLQAGSSSAPSSDAGPPAAANARGLQRRRSSSAGQQQGQQAGAGSPPPRPRVRNYNIKDDEVAAGVGLTMQQVSREESG